MTRCHVRFSIHAAIRLLVVACGVLPCQGSPTAPSTSVRIQYRLTSKVVAIGPSGRLPVVRERSSGTRYVELSYTKGQASAVSIREHINVAGLGATGSHTQNLDPNSALMLPPQLQDEVGAGCVELPIGGAGNYAIPLVFVRLPGQGSSETKRVLARGGLQLQTPRVVVEFYKEWIFTTSTVPERIESSVRITTSSGVELALVSETLVTGPSPSPTSHKKSRSTLNRPPPPDSRR